MKATIKIAVPLVTTFRTYRKTWLRNDLVAGITVAAVAVPQAMAYTQLAGLPLIVGLYTALAAMILFALFSTSRYTIVGPDAAMAALTGATLLPLANGDLSRVAALAPVLGILIGIVCLVALFLRLGVLAELISRPILLGYMAGLALAIIASQSPKMFGIIIPDPGNFFSNIWYILSNISAVSWITVWLSALLLIVAILVKKHIKKLPMSLVILVGSITASYVFSFKDMGIAVVGSVPTGLPIPSVPQVSFVDLQYLVIPALMIALVSYANTIATARAYAANQKENIETPQEFFGLGIANIGSGMFGGMPVAASSARTAVNLQSKAKTQVSQLFGAAAIGLVLLFLAPSLAYLPQAALAVIVILAVTNLFNYSELQSIWRGWKSEAIVAIVTIIGVTVLGIFQGLLLAVFLAVMNLVRRNAFPSYSVLGLAENGVIRETSRHPKTKAIPGLIIFRFDTPLYFVNSNTFKETVLTLIRNSPEPVRWVLWDAETVPDIDSTSARMLMSLMHDLKARDITFAIARMRGPLRQAVLKSKRLSHAISKTPHFSSMGGAIESYRNSVKLSPPLTSAPKVKQAVKP